MKSLKHYIKATEYRLYTNTIGKYLDATQAKKYEDKTKNIETLAMLLGPYRNLSTLSASVMSLHPNCQVLNHAGLRIFPKEKLNFFKNYTVEKYKNFLSFAVYASLGGRMGMYGGAIFKAHAYERKRMREAYYSRYDSHLKENIKCLFWKESHKVSNMLRDFGYEKLLNENKNIKFLLPVRNPISCAKSNLRTGYYKLFKDNITDVESCVVGIFKEFKFFLDLKEKYPNNFYYFFEDEFSDKLEEIADFLNLEKEERWLNDAKEVINLKSIEYDNPKKLIEYCKKESKTVLGDYPEFEERLSGLIR